MGDVLNGYRAIVLRGVLSTSVTGRKCSADQCCQLEEPSFFKEQKPNPASDDCVAILTSHGANASSVISRLANRSVRDRHHNKIPLPGRFSYLSARSSCNLQITCRPVIVPAGNRGEMSTGNLSRQSPGMLDRNDRIIYGSENLNCSGIMLQRFHVIPSVAK